MQVTDVAGKRVTVMGLGRFGGQIEAARFLATHGARVLVTDTTPPEKLADSVAQLAGLPITYRLGEHRDEDFTTADLIVPSPAVPPSNRYLQLAAARGIPIRIEIELMLERLLAKNPHQTIIGVTGTKGKSTTTALLNLMLSAAHPTIAGGNIGQPLINRVDTIAPSGYVLLELSSYMLHYLGARAFRPKVALVTLVSEDHLEWHGGLNGYLAAKQNLLRHQHPTDHAVIYSGSASTPQFAAIATQRGAQVHLYNQHTSPEIPLLIPGTHNQLNAQGAWLAASLLGTTRPQAVSAVATFPGLPHRLELVHQSNGIRYYNDSIATIPASAIAALRSFPADKVIQIVGGSDKQLDMSPLTSALRDHAKAALCIGLLGPSLHAAIGPKSRLCHTLDTALSTARDIATPGDVILLSPGTASYDQYPNFQARGEAFRQLALSA